MICHKSRSNKNLLFFLCFWTDLGLGCILLSIRDLAPFLQFGVLPNLQYGHNILHWGVIQHSYLYLLVRLLVTSWQQVVIMANRLFNVCIYAMIASLGSENMILCIMVVFVLNSFEIWVLRRICLKGDRLFTNSGKKNCGLKSLMEWTNPSPPPLLPLLPCNKAINRG